MLEKDILDKAEAFFLQDGYTLFRIADFFNYLQNNGIDTPELDSKEELFIQVLEKHYSKLKSTKALQSLSSSNENSPIDSIKNILFGGFEESLKTSNFSKLKSLSFSILKDGKNNRDQITEKLVSFYEDKIKLVRNAISNYFKYENLNLLDFDYENAVEYISKNYIGENIFNVICDFNFSVNSQESSLILHPPVEDSGNDSTKLQFLGHIMFYFPERGRGLIYDYETKKKISFSSQEVLGDDLYWKLPKKEDVEENSPPKFLKIKVIYSKIETAGNKIRARLVHSINNIEDLKNKVEDFACAENWPIIQLLIGQVLTQFPYNKTFLDLQEKYPIRKLITSRALKVRDIVNLREKANEKIAENDFTQAITLYIRYIKNEETPNESIREVLKLFKQHYLQLSNKEDDNKERISLLGRLNNFVSREVGKIVSSYENIKILVLFLETLISCDHESVEKISSILLLNDVVKRDSKTYRTLFLLKIKALLNENKYDLAIDTLHEALERFPTNKDLLTLLKDNIYHASIINFPTIVYPDSFISRTNNEHFMNDVVDSYHEYRGVPGEETETGTFSKKTLDTLLARVETMVSSNARAKTFLSICKLTTILNSSSLNSVKLYFSKYCSDMARILIKQGKHPDFIRYYLYLCILYRQEKTTFEEIILYFGVGSTEIKALANLVDNNVSLNDVISNMMTTIDFSKWNIIFDVMVVNRFLASRLVSIFFKDDSFRPLSLKYLEQYTNTSCSESIDLNKYVDIWNKAFSKREKEIYDLESTCSNLTAHNKIEAFCDDLKTIIKGGRLARDWFCSTDYAIHSEINNLSIDFDRYINVITFNEKKSLFNKISSKLDDTVKAIKDNPTYISYEIFLPLLNKIKIFIQESFEDVLLGSEPEVNIELLTDNVLVLDNIAKVQFSLSSDVMSAPIFDVSVQIENTSSLFSDNEIGYEKNTLNGGEKIIFKKEIRLTEDVIEDKKVILNITCNYSFNDRLMSTPPKKYVLKLYSQNEFVRISNPYIAGPVIVEPKMFFGREDFISSIADSIDNAVGKQIVIYGQKRSGKSSVLEFLKRRLEKNKKLFCVEFSLGEIISNLTELSFYHKILNTVAFKLEELEFEGLDVPILSVPNIVEFEKEDPINPLNTFMKYIIKLKHSFRQVEEWKDKQLVVLIDEFTYIYSLIKKGIIKESFMNQWKAVTQNSDSCFSSVLIGQDVISSFKQELYARNAFGIIQDIRLTYLDEKSARELVEIPILDNEGKSRFVGDSVSKLIEFTSRNPYYIQMFCGQLVDYMNLNKIINVTESDIEYIAESFINGENSLTIEKFDNLIAPGAAEDVSEFDEKDVLSVLHSVAENTRYETYCNRNSIRIDLDDNLIDSILKSLVDRDVLEIYKNDSYRIQVNLFQKWLLKHSI